jgi:hypothetical protein
LLPQNIVAGTPSTMTWSAACKGGSAIQPGPKSADPFLRRILRISIKCDQTHPMISATFLAPVVAGNPVDLGK